MGVFAKLDGLKKPPPTAGNLTLCYNTIKVKYEDPKQQAKLQQVGFSRNGISELMDGKNLSNEKDRKLVSIIVASALG